MESQLLKKGYTKVPNIIVDSLARLQVSGCLSRIISVIIRKTYGYRKTIDKISISQFEKFTGLNRRHISRGLNELVERKIIIKGKSGITNTYTLQEDSSLWQLSPHSSCDKIGDSCVSKNGNETISRNGVHKRKEKNNKERELSYVKFGSDSLPFFRRYAQKDWGMILAVLETMEQKKVGSSVPGAVNQLFIKLESYPVRSVIEGCKGYLKELTNGQQSGEDSLLSIIAELGMDRGDVGNGGSKHFGNVACETSPQGQCEAA